MTGGLWLDDLILRDMSEGNLFDRVVGTRFTSITGMAHFSFEHRKLLPRRAEDLVVER